MFDVILFDERRAFAVTTDVDHVSNLMFLKRINEEEKRRNLRPSSRLDLHQFRRQNVVLRAQEEKRKDLRRTRIGDGRRAQTLFTGRALWLRTVAEKHLVFNCKESMGEQRRRKDLTWNSFEMT